MIYSLNFDQNVLAMVNNDNPWETETLEVLKLLRKDFPFVNRTFIVMQNNDCVLSKDGTSSPDTFFSVTTGLDQYTSGPYDKDFWLSLFERASGGKVFKGLHVFGEIIPSGCLQAFI